jgi:hypothetical protein
MVVVVANPSVENPTLCAWLHPTSCRNENVDNASVVLIKFNISRFVGLLHKTNGHLETKEGSGFLQLGKD